MRKKKEKQREKRGVDYWFRRYMIIIKSLFDEDRKVVESYWPAIKAGIDLSTKDQDCQKIEDLDEKRECLEFEELIYYIPIILRSRPSYKFVTDGVKQFTDKRKNSWFDDVIRKYEYLDILRQDIIHQIEVNDVGEKYIADYAIKAKDMSYALFGQNVHNANPLDCFMLSANNRAVDNSIHSVCSSGKHAEIKNRLFEKMFDGVDVTGKNAEEIGANPKKIASIKNQALGELKKIILETMDDDELAQRHKACKVVKGNEKKVGKKKAKRSTFKDRKAQHRKEEHEPIATRIWKFINGKMVLIFDDSGRDPSDKSFVAM
jgi:hypothetical protein